MDDLVSVIVPTYNCEEYILETLHSIKNQTYKNFEVIIIDDCSTDNSEFLINDFILTDNRFKYIKLDENSGAAIARNKGVEMACGKFIAFLDSDDIWVENKLELQLSFMNDNDYLFTSTVYGRINQIGEKLNWLSKYIDVRNYNKLLRRCPGNSTVMYNAQVVGKIFIPNIKKRNDYVMWLTLIKKTTYIYEMNNVLTYYRIRDNSLSYNKRSLIKYHWFVYRKIEKLSFMKSLYLILWFILKGVLKFK